MKIKILVISKYKWASRLTKHENIKKMMMQGGFESIIIDTVRRDIGDPLVKNERIDYDWFEQNITSYARKGDYNFVVWQFSKADKKRWGIETKVHGENLRDGDFFGESWVACDEDDLWVFKDGSTWNEYCKSVPHEIGHELTRQGITTLEVHDFDYKKDINNLPMFYKQLNLKKTMTIQEMIDKVAELKKQLASLPSKDVLPVVKRSAEAVIAEMATLKLPVRIIEGYRSIERQNELYAKGRTAPGAIVTRAKGGESYHNYGCAVDLVFVEKGYNAPESEWQALGSVAVKHGFEWGGSWAGFPDRPHCQITMGYTIADFQKGTVDYTKFN